MVVNFLRKWWRILLVVVLLVAAIQFFVRPPGIPLFQFAGGVVTSLFRPVYESVDFLRQRVSSVWSGYIELVDTSRENAELRKEVAALQEKLKESRDSVLENRRLEELLRFSKIQKKQVVGARVVGHDVSPWFQGIFIDSGTGDDTGAFGGRAKPQSALAAGPGRAGSSLSLSPCGRGETWVPCVRYAGRPGRQSQSLRAIPSGNRIPAEAGALRRHEGHPR